MQAPLVIVGSKIEQSPSFDLCSGSRDILATTSLEQMLFVKKNKKI